MLIENKKTMIRQLKTLTVLSFVAATVALSSCEVEDPGPLQRKQKEFTIIDFDRLEMGSSFHIEVEQANTFSINVEGDRRNIDDLDVYKRGSTLIIEFDENADRKHDTYITITMPRLQSANFSGASVSTVKGFESDGTLDFYISGASIAQLDAGYRVVNAVVSGASSLMMHGLGDELNAEVTGASVLSAFDYPVRQASVTASGSSSGKLTVTDALEATASGSSSILYRGNPVVTADASGSSTVQKD